MDERVTASCACCFVRRKAVYEDPQSSECSTAPAVTSRISSSASWSLWASVRFPIRSGLKGVGFQGFGVLWMSIRCLIYILPQQAAAVVVAVLVVVPVVTLAKLLL